MQRAAASSASNRSPQSSNSAPYTGSTPQSDARATKRRRLSTSQNSSPASTPSTPITPTPIDLSASVSAAVAAEEAARVEALARHCGVTAETKWVLNYPGLPDGINNGTNDENAPETGDNSNSSPEENPMLGRRTYGNFKRRRRSEEGRTEEVHAEDGVSDGDEERQKRTEMEEAYASKAQRKLRDGTDPDKVNLRGLIGKVSGFNKDKGREGKFVSQKKGGRRQNGSKDERRKMRASEG